MTSFVVLESSSPTLDIRKIGTANLKLAVYLQIEVHWNRDGEIRVIPHDVLMNTLRAYLDGLKMMQSDRLAAALAATYTIEWDQTVPARVPYGSGKVEVRLDKVPPVAHSGGDAGGEHAPPH